jgi:hypothetical protein
MAGQLALPTNLTIDSGILELKFRSNINITPVLTLCLPRAQFDVNSGHLGDLGFQAPHTLRYMVVSSK